DKDDIGETDEIVFLHSDPSTANDREYAAALELAENFLHPGTLDVHSGHADDVGPGAARKVDRLHILVDQGNAVPRRGQSGKERQAGDRQDRLGAEKRHRVLETPIGNLEAGIDQDDIGHVISFLAQSTRSATRILTSL